ncbi:MAG: hormogonium polysaccharide secretion pseudopilin HpsB [Spirulina sp.]
MKPKPRLAHPPNAQAGFTIIESLLAIIVVGILIVAIGPVIALSAATRIQARRIEWATQASRTYLDGIQGQTIAPPPLQPVPATTKKNYTDALNSILPPDVTGGLTCAVRTQTGASPTDLGSGYCTTPAPTAQFALYCVDGDNNNACTTDSQRDFLIQAAGVSATGNPTQGYLLGIRVYRADGFKGTDPLKKTDPGATSVKAKTFAGGLGDRKAPIIETITEVIDSDTTFDDLRSIIK